MCPNFFRNCCHCNCTYVRPPRGHILTSQAAVAAAAACYWLLLAATGCCAAAKICVLSSCVPYRDVFPPVTVKWSQVVRLRTRTASLPTLMFHPPPPPPGSWAMTVIPGVRPWEELVGEPNSRAIKTLPSKLKFRLEFQKCPKSNLSNQIKQDFIIWSVLSSNWLILNHG